MSCYVEEGSSVPLLRQKEDKNERFKFTVEFPLLAVLFSSSLTDGVTSNLLLFRTCVIDLQHNVSDCLLLHNRNKTDAIKALEAEVEAATTFVIMTATITAGIMPAVLSLFLGSWSDKYGRKPLLVWPIVGQVISSFLMILFSSITSLSAWWYVPSILPFALLGGGTSLILGANLLVTDLSSLRGRSSRLSVVQGCFFMGMVLGTMASNYCYQIFGYVYLFVISTAIYIVSLLYTMVFVQESIRNGQKGKLKDLFDWNHPKTMFFNCFKRRRKILTTIIFLLITAYGITMFCINGTGNLEYLFTREKFQWQLKDYTIFSAINIVTLVFGVLFGIGFLQGYLKLSDGVVLIMTYISMISDNGIRTISTRSWQIYLASTLSMLSALASPLIRSQITKVIPKEEVGSMYSLMSFVDTLLPILSPLLFNLVYFKTLSTFPGAIYAVSAGLCMICLITVIVAVKLVRVFNKSRESTTDE